MTVDFGAPEKIGYHHFFIEINPEPKTPIYIYEDFGFCGNEKKRKTIEMRAILSWELWTKICDDVKQNFNNRLKEKKESVGSWNIGKVKLDRFLGKELCVLVWAIEHAIPEECHIICQKWLALRPEERWWLYSKTAAEARKAEQKNKGWRKALYYALSDREDINKIDQK